MWKLCNPEWKGNFPGLRSRRSREVAYVHAERVHQVGSNAHLVLSQLDILHSYLLHQLLSLGQTRHQGNQGKEMESFTQKSAFWKNCYLWFEKLLPKRLNLVLSRRFCCFLMTLLSLEWNQIRCLSSHQTSVGDLMCPNPQLLCYDLRTNQNKP